MEPAPSGYLFSNFRIDCVKRRLWRAGEIVPLTPKAFDTLLVLVQAAPAVIEKDDLLKAVWPDTFVEEATLAQNISTLRKALGDTSDTPAFIATVPRRGYRFLEPVRPIPGDNRNRTHTAEITSSPLKTQIRGRFWIPLTAALLVGLAGLWAIISRQQTIRPIVFTLLPPEDHTFSTSGSFMAVSPDGSRIGFIAVDRAGISRLWVRALDSAVALPLAGTEGVSQPFWSADSRFFGFFADGKLKKIDLSTGAVQTICVPPAGSQPLAGTWSARGDILFGSVRQGIFRVSAEGGAAVPLRSITGDGDTALWPQFLPDGRHFLFVITSRESERAGIYVGSLDLDDPKRVSASRSYAVYAPSGHLLFLQNGTLVAQPFDLTTLGTTTDPFPVADQVWFNVATGRAMFSASTNGVLAYRRAAETQLAWFDRSGRLLGPIGPVGNYLQFSLSPADTLVAAARVDPNTGTSDIWILDRAGANARRFTFEKARAAHPLWSRDGLSVVFASDRRGRWEIRRKPLNEDRGDEELLSSEGSVVPTDWSPDGRLLFFQWGHESKGFSLLGLNDLNRSEAGHTIQLPYLGLDENAGRISPDGRWLAFSVWDSGWSVYVQPLHSAEGRWQLSPPGSVEPQPKWRADGKELFFISDDMSLMAVDIEPGETFRASAPHRLFQTQAVAPSGLSGQAYDVASDGQRFLVKVPAAVSPLTVVVGWPARFDRPL